jgi:hypothetical protein
VTVKVPLLTPSLALTAYAPAGISGRVNPQLKFPVAFESKLPVTHPVTSVPLNVRLSSESAAYPEPDALARVSTKPELGVTVRFAVAGPKGDSELNELAAGGVDGDRRTLVARTAEARTRMLSKTREKNWTASPPWTR